MNEEVTRYIQECIRKNGGELPTMDEFNRYLQKYTERQNNRSIPSFDDYSPQEMSIIIDNPWSDASPIKLRAISKEDIESIPLLRQIGHLMSILQREGKIKLTAIGNLPLKFVKEIHPLGLADRIDKKLSKILKETDSISVQFTHIMAKIMKVVKEQKGVMTLTKNGEQLSKQPQLLLEELMSAMCGKYNFGYFDGYEHPHIGGVASGFSIILMAKYGHEKRVDRFYANKYFDAFPKFVDEIVPKFNTAESIAVHCYSFRTFNIFMKHLGLIELEQESFMSDTYVIRTALFDRIFKIMPPKK